MVGRNAGDARSPSWLLTQFAMGRKNYWFTFFADSCNSIFFLIWAWRALSGHPWLVLSSLFFGFQLWGLTEYIFHRWVYHHEKGVFGEGHAFHHTQATLLIAMPWFITSSTVFATWYVIGVRLGFPLYAGLLSGWLAGFVWYSWVHHTHHHYQFDSVWFRRLKAYHRIHHHFPEYNYGVTMRFWDLVFGTKFQKAPASTGPEDSGEPLAGVLSHEVSLVKAS